MTVVRVAYGHSFPRFAMATAAASRLTQRLAQRASDHNDYIGCKRYAASYLFIGLTAASPITQAVFITIGLGAAVFCVGLLNEKRLYKTYDFDFAYVCRPSLARIEAALAQHPDNEQAAEAQLLDEMIPNQRLPEE
jgi:hypothetical protein